MNYWDARNARYERNESDIRRLINDVLTLDPEIEAYLKRKEDRSYHTSAIFFKGEDINSVSFHEVPYRWAGCGYPEFDGSHPGNNTDDGDYSMPFTADDVINTFHPVKNILKHQPSTYFKSKDEYLKWCSWLTKHELVK